MPSRLPVAPELSPAARCVRAPEAAGPGVLLFSLLTQLVAVAGDSRGHGGCPLSRSPSCGCRDREDVPRAAPGACGPRVLAEWAALSPREGTAERVTAGTGWPTRGAPLHASMHRLQPTSHRRHGSPAGSLPATRPARSGVGPWLAAPRSSVVIPVSVLVPARVAAACPAEPPRGGAPEGTQPHPTPSSGPGVTGDLGCRCVPTSFVWGTQTAPSPGGQGTAV